MSENESVKLVRFFKIEGNFCNGIFFYDSCLFSFPVVY